MKKAAWIALVSIACLVGCGSDTNSDQPPAERDKIDNVSNAASKLGYDGEAIEKGLREAENMAKEQEETMKEIFDE